jgi:hypothetical protein
MRIMKANSAAKSKKKVPDNYITLVRLGISLSPASLQHGYVSTHNIRRCDTPLKHPGAYSSTLPHKLHATIPFVLRCNITAQ